VKNDPLFQGSEGSVTIISNFSSVLRSQFLPSSIIRLWLIGPWNNLLASTTTGSISTVVNLTKSESARDVIPQPRPIFNAVCGFS